MVGALLDGNKKITILDKPMIEEYVEADHTKTGLDKESLVFKPRVLRQGLTYFVGVKVRDEGKSWLCQYRKFLDALC